MTGLGDSVDPGLLARFRAAGPKIAWRTVKGARPAARIAHLHDEESYVETRGSLPKREVWTESGPVGALVILLEIDRNGPATSLWSSATVGPRFPQGSLGASWRTGVRMPADGQVLGLPDLVALARYALA